MRAQDADAAAVCPSSRIFQLNDNSLSGTIPTEIRTMSSHAAPRGPGAGGSAGRAPDCGLEGRAPPLVWRVGGFGPTPGRGPEVQFA